MQDWWIKFSSSDSAEVSGRLLRLARNLVVFEFCTLDVVLRTSEVLTDLSVGQAEKPLCSGKGVVRSLTNTGPTTVCEASIGEGGLEFPETAQEGDLGLDDRYRKFLVDHQRLHLISAAYAAAVAGLQNYLWDVRLWLDQIGIESPSSDPAIREAWEKERARELADPIVSMIRELFDRYERQAQSVPPVLVPVYQLYAQRQVRRLLLDAPFVFRTFRKPLGYAGDYQMVDMMFRDPCEGGSLFAKILNMYSLSLPPIVAHRNRIDFLLGQLQIECLRCRSAGRRARILNIGCGPAHDVQSFMARSLASDFAEFCLLDFNQETLDFAQRRLGEVRRIHNRAIEFKFRRRSVQQMVKDSLRGSSAEEGQYDFVYCAGLFDYLPDNLCRQLITVFGSMLAPRGLLLVTNVDTHPSRGQMECFLDWNLVYRNTENMMTLIPPESAWEEVQTRRDPTGVNIFLSMRKPDRHG